MLALAAPLQIFLSKAEVQYMEFFRIWNSTWLWEWECWIFCPMTLEIKGGKCVAWRYSQQANILFLQWTLLLLHQDNKNNQMVASQLLDPPHTLSHFLPILPSLAVEEPQCFWPGSSHFFILYFLFLSQALAHSFPFPCFPSGFGHAQVSTI